MRHSRKIILWCVLAAICVSGLGCHTVHGVGQDVEAAGEAIQRATR
jgi:predicted small secreted protein